MSVVYVMELERVEKMAHLNCLAAVMAKASGGEVDDITDPERARKQFIAELEAEPKELLPEDIVDREIREALGLR